MSFDANHTPTETPPHCYLCGMPLSSPINVDHVPLKGLVAQEIRQKHNLDNLLTIPVHEACNSAYAWDEEYFIAAMMPFAPGAEAGNALFKKHICDYQKGRRAKLVSRVLREFETRPSGLILPPGKVIKRQDGGRIARVVWKIVRGLYFHHHGEVLPEGLNTSVTMTAPGERPPEHFILIKDLPDDSTHGRYPGIFDYRFRRFDVEGGKLHYWAMLFWDRVIMTVTFHDPWHCDCDVCVAALAGLKAA